MLVSELTLVSLRILPPVPPIVTPRDGVSIEFRRTGLLPGPAFEEAGLNLAFTVRSNMLLMLLRCCCCCCCDVPLVVAATVAAAAATVAAAANCWRRSRGSASWEFSGDEACELVGDWLAKTDVVEAAVTDVVASGC